MGAISSDVSVCINLCSLAGELTFSQIIIIVLIFHIVTE